MNNQLSKLEPISQVIQTIADEVNMGNIQPETAYVALKALQIHLDKALKQIQPDAEAELLKYMEGNRATLTTIHGVRVQLNNGRRNYKFDHIHAWRELSDKMKAVEESAKMAAEAYSKGKSFVDESTGEIIEPAVVKLSKPYITVVGLSNESR
jgi:hypothetical protein